MQPYLREGVLLNRGQPQAVILEIAESIVRGETLSVWSAGCAGGEEAFSAAMLLEHMERSGDLAIPWRILATDTDTASLSRAVHTTYSWGAVREVPEHLRDLWFTEEDGPWTLDPRVRSMVTFLDHDMVTMDPPGRFHLVFLRNSILTYNTEEVQRTVLDRIQGCLHEPGYLIIGRTETVPEGAGFKQVSRCIYRKNVEC